MVLDLNTILSAAATGGITGYLTNNLALKMIFKKYGPFGGVVIKTREEFIKSISELVERDIINHETLKEEFTKDEFRKSLNSAAEDFLYTAIPKNISGTKLADIKGWDYNYQVFSSAVSKNLPDFIEKISYELGRNLKLSDLIEEDNLKQITADLYSNFLGELEKQSIFKKILMGLYKELKDKKLSEILSPKIRSQLQNFVQKAADEINPASENQKAAEAELRQNIKNLINISELSTNLAAELRTISLNDIVISQKEIKIMAEGEDFHSLLRDIIINLKIELKNSELKIDDLLTEDIKTALYSDLENGLKLAAPQLKKFIEANKEEIDSFIFSAVETEIDQSSGFKAVSRAGIYSKYREDIEQYGKPSDFILEKIESKTEKKNFQSSGLEKELADNLKKINLSFLADQIKIDETTEELKKLFLKMLHKNRSASLIDLISEELISGSEFEEKLFDLIFEMLKKAINEDDLLDLFSEYTFELTLQKLLDSSDAERAASSAENYLINYLKNNQLNNRLFEYLENNFFNNTADYLNKNSADISEKIKTELINKNKKISAIKMENIYNKFNKRNKSNKNVVNLTDSAASFLYNNLPQILEGRVAQAASTNLNRLSDSDVQQAVEEFMGTELKPITYLGAFIGAAAGLVFNFSGAELYTAGLDPSWLKYFFSALLYGGVGWLTNVIAIWMIFHPYEDKNIMSFKMPFTPGVVAKNKGRFADSMGKFVEKELLKAKSASDLIEENRDEICSDVLNYFSRDNYSLLFNSIDNQSDKLAGTAFNYLQNFDMLIEEDRLHDLAVSSNQFFRYMIKNELTTADYFKKAEEFLRDSEYSSFFSQGVFLEIIDLDKIGELAAASYSIKVSSSSFKNTVNDKKLFPLLKYLLPYLFDQKIEYNLKESVFKFMEKNKEALIETAKKWLYEQQEETARKVNFKKDELLEKEKEKKGGLLKNTLISGALYMADLDEFIDSVVERIFGSELPRFLEDKSEEIEIEAGVLISELKKSQIEFLKSDLLKDAVSSFLKSDQAQNFLNEIIYLSEDEIESLISKIIKDDDKCLMALDFSLESGALKTFINEQFSLEQKLMLLLELKKILDGEVIKEQINYLLRSNDFSDQNNRLKIYAEELNLADLNILSADTAASIVNNFSSLLEDQELEKTIKYQLRRKIENLSELLRNEMDTDSLEYILSILVLSGIDSFEANAEDMLQSLNLKELSAEEVKDMDPAEIEAVFDSFAGKYFTHLKQYGWFGGIFGVLQLLLKNII